MSLQPRLDNLLELRHQAHTLGLASHHLVNSSFSGLYASVLLEHIMTPGLEIGQLFRLVRVEVMAASKYNQVPWESSSLTGSFFFNPGRGIAVTDRPAYSPPKTRKKKERMIPLPTF